MDYYIINEFAKNIDEFRLSFFMHKDKDSKNPKIIAGPVWDFDLAYGNANYYNEWNTQNWMINNLRNDWLFRYQEPYSIPFWCYKIIDDSTFIRKVAIRWYKLRQNSLKNENIMNLIDSLTSVVDEAKNRNFAKWQVLNTYVWPNYYIGKNYADEISYLKIWINERLNWMDLALSTAVSVKYLNSVSVNNFSLKQNYPNPFNSSTVIGYDLPQNSFVRLEIFNSFGQFVETLVNNFQTKGKYSIMWQPKSLSSGMYYYMIHNNAYIEIKKTILLK